ncbi:hypothetical protein Tcan_08892 [Toxocara canis]|uniref:Uncharacterized protein n=1 Tax=Toxocara canis TaxID=6265 RepID=A0A0B2VWZ3_TOXCA|nr:hypothetical protein Tcan_08892 [Toxocara canis]
MGSIAHPSSSSPAYLYVRATAEHYKARWLIKQFCKTVQQLPMNAHCSIMKPLLFIFLTIAGQCMAAAPLFKAVKFPPARIQTRSRGNLNFTEIRERIVKIAGNVTKYSGKVQNGISKMDIQKNKLSEESSEAVVKEKQLTDERHSLEEQLSTATKEVASTSQQLQQTNKQIEKEAQDVRNAQNDLNHKRREKPRWHCIWRCRKKWKKAQRGRIRAAEVVLQAAQQRHANAIKRKAEQEAKLNSLNQRVSSVRTSLARNQQESNRWKERLLNR